jgi:hypothetical protein
VSYLSVGSGVLDMKSGALVTVWSVELACTMKPSPAQLSNLIVDFWIGGSRSVALLWFRPRQVCDGLV